MSYTTDTLGSTLHNLILITSFQCMADGALGAYGLPVIKSVVKASVFELVLVQTRLSFMGTVVVPIIMSQGSVLLTDARVSTMSTCTHVCQSIGRSVSVSVTQSVCQSVCLTVRPSVRY